MGPALSWSTACAWFTCALTLPLRLVYLAIGLPVRLVCLCAWFTCALKSNGRVAVKSNGRVAHKSNGRVAVKGKLSFYRMLYILSLGWCCVALGALCRVEHVALGVTVPVTLPLERARALCFRVAVGLSAGRKLGLTCVAPLAHYSVR